MTGQESTEEVLKAITDKLAELEDLQLVNKLDIINVKNELDKASLSGGPSPEDMEKISELKSLVEKSDRLKKAEKLATEIDDIRTQFEKIKKSDSSSLRRDFDSLSREISVLKGRVSVPAVPSKDGFGKDTVPVSPAIEDLKKRIGKLESAKPGEIDLDVPADIRGEISKINAKLSALEKSRTPSGVAGNMGKIDELSEKIESVMESLARQQQKLSAIESSPKDAKAKTGIDDGKAHEIMEEMNALRAKIEGMQVSFPGREKAGKPAKADSVITSLSERVDLIEKMVVNVPEKREIEKDGEKIGQLQQDLKVVKAKLAGLESSVSPDRKTGKSVKPGKDDISFGLLADVNAIKAKVTGLEASLLAGQKDAKGPGKMPAAVYARLEKLEKMASGLSQGEKKGAKDAGSNAELEAEISMLSARIDGLENGLREKGGKAGSNDDGKLSGIEAEIGTLREKIAGIEKTGSQKGKKGANEDGKLSSLEAEISALRAKISGLEKTGTQKGGKPAKGAAPAMQEISAMQERMERIEKGLEKASRLAMALKPIELPQAPSEKRGPSDIELKVKDLQRTVGAGVGEERFKMLEKKMEEMREWLPEYIDNNVEKKLADTEKKVGAKVRELEGLKKEMINSTIEQMLAQPTTVARMMGEKVSRQVEDLQERIKKVDTFVKPSDAKLTSLIKEISETGKEIAKIKEEMKGYRSAGSGEMSDIGIELKTLAAKLDSMQKGAPSDAKPPAYAKDIADVQKEIARLKEDVKAAKASAKEEAGAKSSGASRDISDVQKEISRVKDEIRSLKSSGRGDLEGMEIELKALATKIESVHGSLKTVEDSGVSGVLRDLEILKTRSEWLESTVHKLDLSKLYERMEELEGIVRSSSHSMGTGAIILE